MTKIESTIKRSIDGNQLVIKCDEVDYRLKMLEANKIPGLLALTIRETDGNKELCYDITSRESFASVVNAKTMNRDDIRSFIYCLSRVLISVEGYLLLAEDLVLDKEYIFVSEDMEPSLCYLPGNNNDFNIRLSSLLQDMLGMVDHNDHDAVVLAYSLYQESLKTGYVMKDLLKILNDDNKREKSNVRDSEYFDSYEATGPDFVMVAQEEEQVISQKDYESLYNAMDLNTQKESKKRKRKRGIMFGL